MARAPLRFVVLTLPLFLALPARAQDDADTRRARELFAEALAHSDGGDWERAVHRLEQALELRDAASIRFNLGVALSHLGRLREATEHLERAIEAEDADASVREGAAARLTEVRARIGHLRVDLTGDPGEAVVTVDGEPWPELGVFVDADPGIREVRLMLGAEVLGSEDADVPEGGEATVTLEVNPAAFTAPEPAGGGDAEGGDDGGVIAGVVIGVVVALAAGGVVAGVLIADELGPQASMGDFDPPVLRAEL